MDTNTNKLSYYVVFNYYLNGEYYFGSRIISNDKLMYRSYTGIWMENLEKYLEQWYRCPRIINIIELKNE